MPERFQRAYPPQRCVSLLLVIAGAILLSPAPGLAGPADVEGTIHSGNLERNYIMHVPLSYYSRKAAPLLLALHGGSGAVTQPHPDAG
jgi:polyhydroxybutyrate depolymerase